MSADENERLRNEVEYLRELCLAVADQLEKSYGHLTTTEFPGPPTSLVDMLREAGQPDKS